MPVPIVPALIGSIIEGIANQPPAPPPRPPGPVVGMMRTLPADSKVGEMAPPWQGRVQINGQMLTLSPAAQIRNENNLLVLPTAIQQSVLVRYTLDQMGTVSRVWILTAAEAAQSEPR